MNFIEKISLLEKSLENVVGEISILKEKLKSYEYLYPEWIPIKQIYHTLNYKSSDGLRKRLLTHYIENVDFKYNGKFIEINKTLFESLVHIKKVSL